MSSIDVMSIAINSISVDENSIIRATFRENLVPVSAAVAGLIESLHGTYNAKPVKGYASFLPEAADRFQVPLKQWQSGSSFLDFAALSTNQLVLQLTKHNIVEGGYVMMCHYRYLATEFLLVTLLGTEHHFSVSKNELTLNSADHLAIAKMQLAARIDLTELKVSPESEKYISFIRGRAGRRVADFFLDFLGCSEGSTPAQHSKTVLAAVESYLAESEHDSTEKAALRKQVFSYCQEQSKQGLTVHLAEIASTLGEDALEFKDVLSKHELEVPSEFPVDLKGLQTLVKFTGSGGGISISFEQKHLGDRVIYDSATDTLTVKGVPPNLKDQLQRFMLGKSQFDAN